MGWKKAGRPNQARNGELVLPRFLLALVLLCVIRVPLRSDARVYDTRNVVLVTLDGVRIEEIFGGADLRLLEAAAEKKPVEESALYREYWAPTKEERRLRLMPFLWGTLLREHGSVAGDRTLGSVVTLSNRHRFSYPGYAEILTGAAHDDAIDSNDAHRNPFPTILELARNGLHLERQEVAAFASWERFDEIVESKEGTITSNAGYEPYPHPGEDIRRLSALQFETPTPWDSVRHDVYTFRFSMAHLATYRPRVLYLALGETDDWAHDKRYDRVLQALSRTDAFLRELWDALERDPFYRGRTTLLITTDHGRGRTPEDWSDHGEKIVGAEDTWLVIASPDVAIRGEWRDHQAIRASQIAPTIAVLLGLEWPQVDAIVDAPILEITAAL